MLVWAALWRAQASHLLMGVGWPLVWGAVKVVRALVLAPFFLLGAGDRQVDAGTSMSHLAQPQCWVALAPCAWADRPMLAFLAASSPARRVAEPVASRGQTECLDWLAGITWRQAWFFAWLAWFAVFLWQRERPVRRLPRPR